MVAYEVWSKTLKTLDNMNQQEAAAELDLERNRKTFAPRIIVGAHNQNEAINLVLGLSYFNGLTRKDVNIRRRHDCDADYKKLSLYSEDAIKHDYMLIRYPYIMYFDREYMAAEDYIYLCPKCFHVLKCVYSSHPSPPTTKCCSKCWFKLHRPRSF